ncbi:LytR C-terminal domain-containing protein [Candidatus Gottesmanbacteria bacterium]|nr:LytR C-terminal domain-containing protein [Candidatus Gottesmanbacteria bacterium]
MAAKKSKKKVASKKKVEKVEKVEKSEEVGKIGEVEKVEKVEEVPEVGRVGNVEGEEMVGKVGEGDKIEQVEKEAEVGKIEKVEGVDEVGKVGKVEEVEKVEKVEKGEEVIGEKPAETEIIKEEISESTPGKDESSAEPAYFIPTERPEVEKKRNYGWIVLFLVGAAVGFGSSLLFYNNAYKKENTKQTVVPSLVPTKTLVTPTVVDYSIYPIEILNGSGIKGEAARAKDLLEGERFKVSSIGNADKNDYDETVLQIKKGLPDDSIKKLKDVLSKYYVLSSEELEDEDGVTVIVGSSKPEN